MITMSVYHFQHLMHRAGLVNVAIHTLRDADVMLCVLERDREVLAKLRKCVLAAAWPFLALSGNPMLCWTASAAAFLSSPWMLTR